MPVQSDDWLDDMLPVDHERPVAWYQGQAISREVFVTQAYNLAKALPPTADYVINFCADRYHFMLGFIATLINQKINVLPPNQLTATLRRLQIDYPANVMLTDALNPDVANEKFNIATWLADLPFVPSTQQSDIPTVPTSTKQQAKQLARQFAMQGDETAALVFTSGSTGAPKANCKTLRQLAGVAQLESRWMRSLLQVADDEVVNVVATVPGQHMYGLETSVLTAVFGGLTSHHQMPFYPADIIAALAAIVAPRVLVTTPTHLRVMVKSGKSLPDLSLIVCATAPLTNDLAQAAERQFACPVHEIYGFSEAGAIAHRAAASPVWQLFDGLQLSRLDGGHFAVSGLHLLESQVIDDIIDMHDAYSFSLQGRSSDRVNIAGKRTSLLALTQILLAIDGVEDGVFFLPNEAEPKIHDTTTKQEVRLAAIVVAPDLSENTLMQRLAEQLDPVFLPRPLCKVDVLPRNATGKLSQASLTALCVAHRK